MLRIGPPATDVAPLPDDDALPVDPDQDAGAESDADEDDSPAGRYDAQKVDQKIVLYMTSDQGPFECQNCEHFEQPNKCGIVNGAIDPQGCCNLFTPPTHVPHHLEGGPDDQGDAEQPTGAPIGEAGDLEEQ